MFYQLETVPIPIKDNNTEVNSHTWLQPRKDYLAMIEENYISLTYTELNTYKHIGHEYFCETIYLVTLKTSQSCKSAVFFILLQILLIIYCEFRFLFNKTHCVK